MMGTSKKRKTYTPEYRREAAAHLVIDTGRTIAAVASEIGVGAQLLGRWGSRKYVNFALADRPRRRVRHRR